MKKKKITIALSRAAKIMLACLITLIAMTGCDSSANGSSAKDEDDKTQTSSLVQTTAPVPNNGMSSAAINDNSSSIRPDDSSSSKDESSIDESSKDESSSLASESVVADSSSSNSDNSTVDGPIATTRDTDGLYEYALYGTKVKMGVNINEFIKTGKNGPFIELYRLAATYNWLGNDTYSDPEDENYKALSSTFFTHRSGDLKTVLRPLNYSATIDEFGGQQLSYLLVDFLREDGENYYSSPNEATCNVEVNFKPHSDVCVYCNLSTSTWVLSQEDLVLLAFIIWHEDQYPGTNALNSYPDLKKVAIYYSAPLGEHGKASYLFS